MNAIAALALLGAFAVALGMLAALALAVAAIEWIVVLIKVWRSCPRPTTKRS